MIFFFFFYLPFRKSGMLKAGCTYKLLACLSTHQGSRSPGAMGSQPSSHWPHHFLTIHFLSFPYCLLSSLECLCQTTLSLSLAPFPAPPAVRTLPTALPRRVKTNPWSHLQTIILIFLSLYPLSPALPNYSAVSPFPPFLTAEAPILLPCIFSIFFFSLFPVVPFLSHTDRDSHFGITFPWPWLLYFLLCLLLSHHMLNYWFIPVGLQPLHLFPPSSKINFCFLPSLGIDVISASRVLPLVYMSCCLLSLLFLPSFCPLVGCCYFLFFFFWLLLLPILRLQGCSPPPPRPHPHLTAHSL